LENGCNTEQLDKKEVCAIIRFLWAKNTEPVTIHSLAVYDANVMSVQQMRKWCRDFPGGRLSVLAEDRIGGQSASDAFVSVVNAFFRADRRVSLKQLPLAWSISH
jgi:hypothetical protein